MTTATNFRTSARKIEHNTGRNDCNPWVGRNDTGKGCMFLVLLIAVAVVLFAVVIPSLM